MSTSTPRRPSSRNTDPADQTSHQSAQDPSQRLSGVPAQPHPRALGRTGDTRDAIVHGVASTARLITGAAAIIVVVFAGFATGQLVPFQQMGFGIAIALAIDATLVRLILIPAAMGLLGERNWYLPRWLAGSRTCRSRGSTSPTPQPSRDGMGNETGPIVRQAPDL